MKNKRIFVSAQILVLSALIFSGHYSFAALSDCANPVEVALSGSVKMKFCEIPAASGVLIGSAVGQRNEAPVVARDFRTFQMGQFEVTQHQYRTLTGQEPWKNSNGTLKEHVRSALDNPAVYVSQLDGAAFARIMNLVDPTATYRLPTEAEWEYAARGGTNTRFYWGDDFDSNFTHTYVGNEDDYQFYARLVYTCPNTTLNSRFPGYCANSYGLMHMIGNVAEWCQDAYGLYTDTQTNGHVAVIGDTYSYRVTRGGSYSSMIVNSTVSRRLVATYSDRTSEVGFRLVRIPH